MVGNLGDNPEKLISSCNLPVIGAIYRGYMGTQASDKWDKFTLGTTSQGYLSVSHWDDHPSMSGVQKGTAIYWTLPRSSHRVCPKMMATFQKTLFSMKWSFLGKSHNFWLFATDINAVRFGTLPWLLIQGPLYLLWYRMSARARSRCFSGIQRISSWLYSWCLVEVCISM